MWVSIISPIYDINGYAPFLIDMFGTILRGRFNMLRSRYLLWITFFTPLASFVFCYCYTDFDFISNLCFGYFSFNNLLLDYNCRFLKCSFHFWSLSSWLVAFNFALEALYLLLILFTVCSAIFDGLSSQEFLILLVWPWLYYNCSFWYLFVSSFRDFLSFCVLAFVELLLLSKDVFFNYHAFF